MDFAVNPYVSVDCVLLGFDGEQLNVLIVRQSGVGGEDSTGNYKLPGSLIYMNENLDEAAQRVLKQLTGLAQVNMMQFKAFGGIDRLQNPADSVWLERFHHLDHHIERIVTIASNLSGKGMIKAAGAQPYVVFRLKGRSPVDAMKDMIEVMSKSK